MVENTSTTLISVEQYRKYCFGHIQAYGETMSSAGKRVILHMCGHLKALLDDLAKLPVAGFEAFTSPTLGNTTLLDGRSRCPDKCLIGGTQATLWLKPADEIIVRIKHDLDELPHHRGIVVTSAGVMPPMCPPKKIKTVCDWVHAYPARW
jgi:uroporphyrinogen-III decarboxylase